MSDTSAISQLSEKTAYRYTQALGGAQRPCNASMPVNVTEALADCSGLNITHLWECDKCEKGDKKVLFLLCGGPGRGACALFWHCDILKHSRSFHRIWTPVAAGRQPAATDGILERRLEFPF